MNAVRSMLRREGRDVASVARQAGLSRQAVYRMLDPSWDPLPSGFRAVARALGVDPVALLTDDAGAPVAEASVTLRDAARGDARAFEVLPVLVGDVGVASRVWATADGEPAQRLLLAAASIAAALWLNASLAAWVEAQLPALSSTSAFFFAAQSMSPDRVVASTPEPLRRLRVFGAFALDDFARHRA